MSTGTHNSMPPVPARPVPGAVPVSGVPAGPVPAAPVPAGSDSALRAINIGVWAVAVVVMVVSATTAAKLLADHGMHWLQGLALGLAVDAGIVVALVGDRMLHRAVGRRSRWGTALRLVTAAMSLLLNCAGAWQAGDELGVALHALPPTLLIVLAEAAQSYRMTLSRSNATAAPATEPAAGTGPVSTQRPPQLQYPPTDTRPAGTGPVGTGASDTRPVGTDPASTATAPLTGTDRTMPAGTAPVSPAGTGLTLVRENRKAAAAERDAEPDEWDQELWQRAVALAEQHRRDIGRDIRLDDVQTGLSIGRNRAAALRRDVLSHLQRQKQEASSA